MPKNFAVIGVGGYIAPRHLRAIRDTGNRLVAAVDPKDSVGILDQFSYDVSFFTEFERFDRHIERLRRLRDDTQRVHCISICSPNHLHDAHIRFALRVDADAICEKPLVLNPWNCDALAELEAECGRRVYTVLQLRLHPALKALKAQIANEPEHKRHEVVLTYITARGLWYFFSWKGAPEKSGGLATNIGIHFFDLLIWLFGAPQRNELHYADPKRTSGYLELERATVKWYLSVAPEDVPDETRAKGKMTYRSLTMDGQEIEFSEGFTDLHTKVYEEVLQGRGFGIAEVKPSIQITHDIRHAEPLGMKSHSHDFLRPR